MSQLDPKQLKSLKSKKYTSPVNEDGVADVIKKFILNNT